MARITRKPLTEQEIVNIVAWYTDGVPTKKIAKAVGRTPAAIQTILHRCKSGNYESVNGQIRFLTLPPQPFPKTSNTTPVVATATPTVSASKADVTLNAIDSVLRLNMIESDIRLNIIRALV